TSSARSARRSQRARTLVLSASSTTAAIFRASPQSPSISRKKCLPTVTLGASQSEAAPLAGSIKGLPLLGRFVTARVRFLAEDRRVAIFRSSIHARLASFVRQGISSEIRGNLRISFTRDTWGLQL